MMLAGRKAIITGASRGIGAAVAELFAREGADLILIARSSAIADRSKKLADSYGRAVTPITGDLTSGDFLKSVVLSAKQKWGRVDILVNNAGLLTPARIGMLGSSDLDAMYAVNIKATLMLTQYVVRLMTNGGSIINLASIAGTLGLEQMSTYSATKGAVVAFTRAAAKELGDRNIRVNAIAPGFIATDMTEKLGAEVLAQNLAKIRMKRVGTPLDVANSALFLASDMSSYVTGQVIGVDGGFVV